MAHVADELEHDREQRSRRDPDDDALPRGEHVPNIVSDKRQLRVVPWAGEGPDPLGEVEL